MLSVDPVWGMKEPNSLEYGQMTFSTGSVPHLQLLSCSTNYTFWLICSWDEILLNTISVENWFELLDHSLHSKYNQEGAA